MENSKLIPFPTPSTETATDREATEEASTQAEPQAPKASKKASKKSGRDKSSERYWRTRVYPRVDSKIGKLVGGGSLHVRFQVRGVEGVLNLETCDRTKAASLARDLYLDVKRLGWTAVKAHGLAVPGITQKGKSLTVGELLSVYELNRNSAANTISGNRSATRRFVCEVLANPKLPKNAKKFEKQIWENQVDAILIRDIKTNELESWHKRNSPSTNPKYTVAGKPISSVNSLLRSVNSVFADEAVRSVLSACGLEFPKLKEFPVAESHYEELVSPQTLLDQAAVELRGPAEEEYKLLLLTLGCGLRRSEADLLLWTAFDWKEGYLKVEPSSFYGLKTLSSQGKVKLQHEVLAYFHARFLAEREESEFVLISSRPPMRHLVSYTYYRADKTGNSLVAWLRSKGVDHERPLSEMRKAFGNEICKKHGSLETQRALRHKNVKTTITYYLKGRSDGTTDYNL